MRSGCSGNSSVSRGHYGKCLEYRLFPVPSSRFCAICTLCLIFIIFLISRTPFDQFSKQYLEELLTPLGQVEISREVPGESRFEVCLLGFLAKRKLTEAQSKQRLSLR